MCDGVDFCDVVVLFIEIIQKYIYEWLSASYDLFGGEDFFNVVEVFVLGVKGCYCEGDGLYKDLWVFKQVYWIKVVSDFGFIDMEIFLCCVMNVLFFNVYYVDCRCIVVCWNCILKKFGVDYVFKFFSVCFNWQIGIYFNWCYNIDGDLILCEDFECQKFGWFLFEEDCVYVCSCQVVVVELGKFVNWVVLLNVGINRQLFDFEYVCIY